jgi:hypothetical protein
VVVDLIMNFNSNVKRVLLRWRYDTRCAADSSNYTLLHTIR